MKETEKCDINSFEVVLLELITGRSPVQPLDKGGDLVTWVRKSIHDTMDKAEIYDKRLDLNAKRTVEEMSLVLKIAPFCTSTNPLSRPTRREVIGMMIDTRESESNSFAPISETPLDEDDSCKC